MLAAWVVCGKEQLALLAFLLSFLSDCVRHVGTVNIVLMRALVLSCPTMLGRCGGCRHLT
jgi:hypothetical protein